MEIENVNVELGSGYTSVDHAAIRELLSFTLKNTTRSPKIQLAVVGGVAARYWLAKGGKNIPSRGFTNLDIAVVNLDVLKTSVLNRFIVLFKSGPDYMNFVEFPDMLDVVKKTISKGRLVFPTLVKVHVFATHFPPVSCLAKCKLAGRLVYVAKPEYLVARMLLDTKRVLEPNGFPVDPNQFATIETLLKLEESKLFDTALLQSIWETYFAKEANRPNWFELWQEVQKLRNTKRVVEKPFAVKRLRDLGQRAWWIVKFGTYSLFKLATHAKSW